MQEITLTSGNKLSIQTPRFYDVMELIRCACRELRNNNIFVDIENINGADVLSMIMTLVGSKDFDGYFWNIAKNCLYNGERITESLFDDREESRSDFFEIEYKILEATLKPFGKSLLTISKQQQIVK